MQKIENKVGLGNKITRKIRKEFPGLFSYSNRIRSANKQKVYCIGYNKTGTTTIKEELIRFGFVMGDQRAAERLYPKICFENQWDLLREYCGSAQAFQDVPFSVAGVFPYLDEWFPNSKFILTVRDTPEQWYSSLLRFHTKKFGRDGKCPTGDDLMKAEYISKGWMYNIIRRFGTSHDRPYQPDVMMANYSQHINDARLYFSDRDSDFIEINVAIPEDYQRLCNFLNVKPSRSAFLHANRT